MTMSNPAKILLAYMRCSGISDAKQLATDLDIPIRTIQRLKLECATSANDAISGAANDAKCAISGGSKAPIAPDMALARDLHSCAGATNELPSEVSSYIEVSYPLAPMPIVKPKRLRSQGSRLPNDFELPEDWRQWAKVNCLASDAQIDTEAANFADYWIAKPSQATSLDWKRTWQKWARKSFSPAGNRRPQSTGTYGTSPEKHQVEGISAMIARLKSEGAIQ
jgi:hypothetical protein